MKARLVAATIAMCLLYGVSSAQTYAIRVTYNTNLRASYSLESAIIETAPAGTTLQVVGKSGRWLRISRNGKEVWMADWVAYSRVEGGEPTPGQATGDIDNCCFVDRQCTSDLDWAEGYHAFQNNQCGAPAQSGAPASSQPASGVILRTASGIVIGSTNGLSILPSTSYTLRPALGQTISFSNCCELNWQCNSDLDWAEGYGAFQNNFQCALPGEVISIVGDPDFVDYLAQRLDQLRNRLPHRYNYVLSGLDKIQQAPADLLAGHVDDIGRIFYVPWTGPRVDGWEKRLSAVLVHEACHVHRYAAGYKWSGCDPEATIREETICREMELEVVIELDAPLDVIEWVRGMVARTRTGENLMLPGGC